MTEIEGAIPIESSDPFDTSLLLLGQRPFAEMSYDEMVAGIKQLRDLRDPLQQGATRRSLNLPTRPPALPRKRPSRTPSLDAVTADMLSSMFSTEEENEK